MYKTSYVSDGTTTEYAFSFSFFQNADVKVSVDDGLLGDIDYTVIPNNDFNGGTVCLAVAPQSGKKIDVFRHVSLNRIIDYQPTLKIDPEDLNSDFNFLLAVCQDLQDIDIDVSEWANLRENILPKINYVIDTISDKMSGGAVLGLYNNLLNVLDSALPQLINDYGLITEGADNATSDDYGSI